MCIFWNCGATSNLERTCNLLSHIIPHRKPSCETLELKIIKDMFSEAERGMEKTDYWWWHPSRCFPSRTVMTLLIYSWNSFMWSLASVHRFLFVSKSSVCMYYKQIQTFKSISHPKTLGSLAKIKVYQVGNTHSVPSGFKCSGVVKYQKRWKWVRFIKRRILADAEIHKQKLENTFDGWILIMTCLFSG